MDEWSRGDAVVDDYDDDEQGESSPSHTPLTECAFGSCFLGARVVVVFLVCVCARLCVCIERERR